MFTVGDGIKKISFNYERIRINEVVVLNVLITGKSGYIATAVASKFISKNVKKVNNISLKGTNINKLELDGIDVVIHTAALVHKKESHYTMGNYFEINHNLTLNLAKAAKSSGVRQFIFISTMAVYGKSSGEINSNSLPKPTTYYGKSKLEAENDLRKLQDDDFVVTVIRPPMVYGPYCPGNYRLLSYLAIKSPIFPKVDNKRSAIFIEHLTELIFLLTANRKGGIFHPQDSEYVCTSEMVKHIANSNKKKIHLDKTLGLLMISLLKKYSLVNKVFGDLYYSFELSSFKEINYCKYSLQEAINITETSYKETDEGAFKTSN